MSLSLQTKHQVILLEYFFFQDRAISFLLIVFLPRCFLRRNIPDILTKSAIFRWHCITLQVLTQLACLHSIGDSLYKTTKKKYGNLTHVEKTSIDYIHVKVYFAVMRDLKKKIVFKKGKEHQHELSSLYMYRVYKNGLSITFQPVIKTTSEQRPPVYKTSDSSNLEILL